VRSKSYKSRKIKISYNLQPRKYFNNIVFYLNHQDLTLVYSIAYNVAITCTWQFWHDSHLSRVPYTMGRPHDAHSTTQNPWYGKRGQYVGTMHAYDGHADFSYPYGIY
jgi:hypothetical protein